MTERNEVTFRMEVNHDAVKAAIKDLESRPESRLIREGLMLVYSALLCSDVIYVPESQLMKYIPFCKEVN